MLLTAAIVCRRCPRCCCGSPGGVAARQRCEAHGRLRARAGIPAWGARRAPGVPVLKRVGTSLCPGGTWSTCRGRLGCGHAVACDKMACNHLKLHCSDPGARDQWVLVKPAFPHRGWCPRAWCCSAARQWHLCFPGFLWCVCTAMPPTLRR